MAEDTVKSQASHLVLFTYPLTWHNISPDLFLATADHMRHDFPNLRVSTNFRV